MRKEEGEDKKRCVQKASSTRVDCGAMGKKKSIAHLLHCNTSLHSIRWDANL